MEFYLLLRYPFLSLPFAEEQLETINVEGELNAERQTQAAVEHKSAAAIQKELFEIIEI